jgi:hypothetical protein
MYLIIAHIPNNDQAAIPRELSITGTIIGAIGSIPSIADHHSQIKGTFVP